MNKRESKVKVNERCSRRRQLLVLVLLGMSLSGGLKPLPAQANGTGGFAGSGGLSDILSGGLDNALGNGSGGVGGLGGGLTDMLSGGGGSDALGGALDGVLGELGLDGLTDSLGGLEDVLGSGSGGIGNILDGLGGLFGDGGSGESGSSPVSSRIQQIMQGISQVGQAVSQGNQMINQILSPIQQFASQIEEMAEGGFARLLESMGGGGASSEGARPELNALLRQAMGALNLPDPNVIAQNIAKVTESDDDRPVLSGVNQVTRDEIAKAMLNAESARLIAGQVLSKEAQEAMAEQLKGIMDMSQQGRNLAQASEAMATQSTQAGALGAAAGQASTQAAAAVAQSAQGAQSAVSTQDVLKAQASISALQSTQLSALSDQAGAQSAQLSAQSSQLGNISNQLASDTQIQVFQTTQLQQISQNMAATNQGVADINELEQGRRQQEQVDESSQAREVNSAWSRVNLR